MSLPARLHARLLGRGGPAAAVPISVVVPLYNHAAYIGSALASVLAQSVPAHEIIVVDDGSADDGAAIAARALRHHPRAVVLRQDNRGAHAAINRAVERATGTWIAVLNSDDAFLADKLGDCQVLMAGDPTAELICGGIALVGGDGRRLHQGDAVAWLARATAAAARLQPPALALLAENFVVTTSNMVFSRGLWQRLGGFAPLRYCHDLDFLLRGLAQARAVFDLARAHVRYRVHGANTIAEDRVAVDVEIAAVLAVALRLHGAALLPDDAEEGVSAVLDMLRQRRVADLAVYFGLLHARLPEVHGFYRHVTAAARRERYAAQLRVARA